MLTLTLALTASQVVGHAKTCLVLVGGYVLFPAKNMDDQQATPNPSLEPRALA